MGLYDSIYLRVKCPKCKQENLLECQTKDLGCSMEEYFIDDHIDTKSNGLFSEITQVKKVHCITECRSYECLEVVRMPDGKKEKKGYYFMLYLILRGGKITGEYIYIGEA
jgi:hypothetical protein